MKTIRVIVELQLEDESKTPAYIVEEVYDALSNNYVFTEEEVCKVEPA